MAAVPEIMGATRRNSDSNRGMAMSELEWDDRLELNRAQLATRPVLDRDLLTFIARRWAQEFGLDPALVCALCEVEGWNPWAVRYEYRPEWLFGKVKDDFPGIIKFEHDYPGDLNIEVQMQCTSWGLMGIKGADARKLGFTGWLTELCDPQVNLEWGCQHLRWLLDHAGSTNIRASTQWQSADLAAAWNGGKVRIVDGKYVNEDYVKRVVRAMVNYVGQ